MSKLDHEIAKGNTNKNIIVLQAKWWNMHDVLSSKLQGIMCACGILTDLEVFMV